MMTVSKILIMKLKTFMRHCYVSHPPRAVYAFTLDVKYLLGSTKTLNTVLETQISPEEELNEHFYVKEVSLSDH